LCRRARRRRPALAAHRRVAFNHPALLQVAAANAGALRELHACEQDEPRSGISVAETEALLLEAPLLEVLDTTLSYDITAADVGVLRAALRNAAPFGALRARRLHADLAVASAAEVVALAADVAAHAALRELTLEEAHLGAGGALDAVVDAALAGRLESVCFLTCGFPPASAPALARLLRSEALTTLEFSTMHFLDAPAAAVLAPALRGNATLTCLAVCNGSGVFDDADAAAALLGALTGHGSLRALLLCGNRVAAADQAAVGGALGALIAANAPALTQLEMSYCGLADVGLRPLFQALPRNTHLRALACMANDASAGFIADVALPAARACIANNGSLRRVDGAFGGGAAAHELHAELARRVAADAAAAAAAAQAAPGCAA
jgi:hypothetical protein